jgi:hypothetical protein
MDTMHNQILLIWSIHQPPVPKPSEKPPDEIVLAIVAWFASVLFWPAIIALVVFVFWLLFLLIRQQSHVSAYSRPLYGLVIALLIAILSIFFG